MSREPCVFEGKQVSQNLSQSETDAFQRHIRRMKFFPSVSREVEPSTVLMPAVSRDGNGNGGSNGNGGYPPRGNVQASPLVQQGQRDIIPTMPLNTSRQQDAATTMPLVGPSQPERIPTYPLADPQSGNGIKTTRLDMPVQSQQVARMPLNMSMPPQTVRPLAMNMPVQPRTIAPLPPVNPGSPKRLPIEMRDKTWKPGTFGFDDRGNNDAFAFKKEDTFPMMVLKGISKQQGQSTPVMQSEISGAASSASIVGVGTIAGNFFRYGNNLLIQRGFGPSGFGLYTLGMSIVNLVSSIFNLGLDDAMVRYVSIYRGKKQPHLLRGVTVFCTALVAVTGILGAFFVLFFAPFLAKLENSTNVMLLLQMMAPIIPLTCMQAIWSGGLQGFKAFQWRVLTQRMLMPGVLLILLLFVVFFFRNLTGVVLAVIASTAIAAVISLYFFYRMLRNVSNLTAEEYELREWLGFASFNFLSSTIETIMDSVDTLLLAFFAIKASGIGQYGAAIRISIFIIVPLQSLNVMFTPTIAELYSRGEKQKLEAMFKVVTKWTITFSLPIFWVASLFSYPILDISGKGFAPAWPLLVAFSLSSMANAATGCVGYMLLMTGHQRTSFVNSLVAIVFNVGLGILLTPRYGTMGVALATGIAICIVNTMRLLQVYIFLKMHPYRWDTLKPIVASFISAAVTGGLIYLVSRTHLALNIGKVSFSLELALIPVFLAVYAGLIVLFRVSPEDQIVLNALRKKLGRGKKKNKTA
jgi:O-antigen/teichoic acid export membrane protein